MAKLSSFENRKGMRPRVGFSAESCHTAFRGAPCAQGHAKQTWTFRRFAREPIPVPGELRTACPWPCPSDLVGLLLADIPDFVLHHRRSHGPAAQGLGKRWLSTQVVLWANRILPYVVISAVSM